MPDIQIASKYSQALFMLGKELNKLDDFYREIEEFQNLLRKNQQLGELFYHHQLPPEKKKRVLKEIFQGELSEHFLNFLLLLVDKRREGEFPGIKREFIRLYDREKGIIKVEVISAVKLNKKQLKKIKGRLKKIVDSEIRLNNKVDPEIIGGLILRIGDNLIDGSIRKELDSLRERIEDIRANELGVEEDAVKA